MRALGCEFAALMAPSKPVPLASVTVALAGVVVMTGQAALQLFASTAPPLLLSTTSTWTSPPKLASTPVPAELTATIASEMLLPATLVLMTPSLPAGAPS
ncbi:hypothetical protein D3C83_29020 [compost metagenome]